MFWHSTRVLGAVALLGGFAGILLTPVNAKDRSTHPSAVRIGMISSLFNDVPEATVMAMMQPFAALIKAQTGVTGELVPCGDADNLGQQLMGDRVQLGVFHGIEFAWARHQYPELRPLVIAVNQQRYLRAHIVVRADSNVSTLRDLQDKTLALPNQTWHHCRLFLRRRCLEWKKEPATFFAKITKPANVEDALDDVVDGVAQVCVVDGVSLDCYKRRKPGRVAKLKIVQSSEIFPAAVVAYRTAILDDATRARLRVGLMNANRAALGRELLTLWKLTGFEQVPPDYDQTLTEIVKAYPSPLPSTK
jgi:ABC-type phosphate/phosphonate transport system substrate-binding protein